MKDYEQNRPDAVQFGQQAGLLISEAAVEFGEPAQPIMWDSRREIIELIGHLVHYSSSLLLVTGKQAQGKTTCMHQVCDFLGDGVLHVVLDAKDLHDKAHLISALADAFHLSMPDFEHTVTQALLDPLHQQLELENRFAVVLVDNAECWPQAMVEILLQWAHSSAELMPRLKFLLFAQRGFEHKLQHWAGPTRQDVLRMIPLPDLSEKDVHQYLLEQLKQLGWQGGDLFTAAQIAQVKEHATAGNFDKLDHFARQVLHAAGRKAKKLSLIERGQEVASWFQRKPVFTSLAVIVMLFNVWLLSPSSNTSTSYFDEQTQASVDIAPRTQWLANLPVQTSDDEVNQAQFEDGLQPMMDEEPIALVDNTTFSSDVVFISEPDEQGLVQESLQAEDSASVLQLARAISSRQPLLAKDAASRPSLANVGASQPTLAKDAVSQPPLAKKTTKQLSLAQQSISPSMRKPAKTEQMHPAYLPDEQALLAMGKNHFTLQLSGSYDKAGLERFIKSQKLNDQGHIVRRNRLDKIWYAYVSGEFNSRQEAKAAISHYGPGIKRFKPWVRSIAQVQQRILELPTQVASAELEPGLEQNHATS